MPSAKAHRVSLRRKENKLPLKSKARNQITKVRKLISDGEFDKAQETASEVYSSLDRAAQRGAIHPKNAARRKSRIMKAIQDVVSSSGE